MKNDKDKFDILYSRITSKNETDVDVYEALRGMAFLVRTLREKADALEEDIDVILNAL
jgi:hypothetical protein